MQFALQHPIQPISTPTPAHPFIFSTGPLPTPCFSFPSSPLSLLSCSFVLLRSHTSSHSCRMFMVATAASFPEDAPPPPSHQSAPEAHPCSLLRCSLNSGADTCVPLGTKQSLVQPVTRDHPPTEAESCTKLWVHIELFRRFFNDLPI